MDKCKAYLCNKRGEFEAAVVFAETAGKAKALARHTDACEDADFTSVEVRRVKAADKYYKPGKWELSWFKAEDRIALVKDCGFTCIPDAHCREECADCPAADICDDYIGSEDDSE